MKTTLIVAVGSLLPNIVFGGAPHYITPARNAMILMVLVLFCVLASKGWGGMSIAAGGALCNLWDSFVDGVTTNPFVFGIYPDSVVIFNVADIAVISGLVLFCADLARRIHPLLRRAS